MRNLQASIKIETWFRESTGEWIGEISYDAGGIDGSARYTGRTESEARNAAFAAIGYLLLKSTWDKPE